MDKLQKSVEYAHNHHDQFLTDLTSLISIPSISTSPENKPDMYSAAEWLRDHLEKIGVEKVQIFDTPGHPVVYGEKLAAGAGKSTVLIYGHYDVQPFEPLDLWKTPPFKAEQKGENLYARGASDMKGQVIASLSAVEAILANGEPPVNLKFILEGEEEIGSTNLPAFIQEHADLLKCDIVLNPDAGMVSPETPTIVYALRGLAYFELRVTGPDHDLHSGVFGGVVHNPAIVLAEIIAAMHDSNGRITLPGFYDSVRHLGDEERKELSRLPIDDEYFIHQAGVSALFGEKGYTAIERVGARPSLDVNGLFSGYTGQGSKTIIPSWAMAKISTRLVPDQDPNMVHQQLLSYLAQKMPPTVRWELKMLGGGAASISNRFHPAVKAFGDSLAEVWKTQPVYKREGGSVPITADFQRILGAESILTGFGLPGDLIHSPNEHLHLPTWRKGIDALIHFFYKYAEIN